ncbi:MAG: hypothetical protein AAGG51_14010, partial [Cyanobacteria bacterium P01_G01_bin.54]
MQGSVGSKDWEVFAAILLNDRARKGDGADLEHYEVKSATTGSSFEYQYHRNHGLDKLTDDRSVDHIFVSRSKDYINSEGVHPSYASPHPKSLSQAGRGTLNPAPLLLFWVMGLGDEGDAVWMCQSGMLPIEVWLVERTSMTPLFDKW